MFWDKEWESQRKIYFDVQSTKNCSLVFCENFRELYYYRKKVAYIAPKVV